MKTVKDSVIDFSLGVAIGLGLGVMVTYLSLLPSDAEAKEVRVTLGVSTPLGNQDIRDSSGKLWETGDIVGSVIISTGCGYVDCSIWHNSIILDTKDVGVTGMGISKTWSFDL